MVCVYKQTKYNNSNSQKRIGLVVVVLVVVLIPTTAATVKVLTTGLENVVTEAIIAAAELLAVTKTTIITKQRHTFPKPIFKLPDVTRRT